MTTCQIRRLDWLNLPKKKEGGIPQNNSQLTNCLHFYQIFDVKSTTCWNKEKENGGEICDGLMKIRGMMGAFYFFFGAIT